MIVAWERPVEEDANCVIEPIISGAIVMASGDSEACKVGLAMAVKEQPEVCADRLEVRCLGFCKGH